MPVNLNDMYSTMGWNQLVRIDFTDLAGFGITNETKVLRVDSYNIGVSQQAEAPDYVTGRQDRTAWKRGPITSQGDLKYPFTLSVGIDMFKAAALLAANPRESFSIESSGHPKMSGCKINNTSLECTAENEVESSSTVWGIVDDEALSTIRSYGSPNRLHWGEGTGGMSLQGKQVGSNDHPGTPDGEDVSGAIELEQIPMFDVCSVEGAPAGMFITGFTLEIDNQLQRNYTMGSGSEGSNQSVYSPYGLNATSISAKQRKVTGTVTWQSDYQGYISQILGSGLWPLTIRIANYQFVMQNALWMAEPPTLSAGDRMTVQSSFIAMGSGASGAEDFDAIIIEDNSIPLPGL